MNALDCVRNAVFTALIEETRVATDADPLAIAPVHGAMPGAVAAGPAVTHCARAATPGNSISANAAHVIACVLLTPHADAQASLPTQARSANRPTPIIARPKHTNCQTTISNQGASNQDAGNLLRKMARQILTAMLFYDTNVN
jgi:hypothetical protein